MGGAEELVARLEKIRNAVADKGARAAVEAMAPVFLHQLEDNTPVLTGALFRGEEIDSITSDGMRATARIGTHTPLYASFRETGGTIHVKHASVLTDGTHFFGKSVTQAGSWYMRRTVEWAEGGALQASCDAAIQRVIDEAGG